MRVNFSFIVVFASLFLMKVWVCGLTSFLTLADRVRKGCWGPYRCCICPIKHLSSMGQNVWLDGVAYIWMMTSSSSILRSSAPQSSTWISWNALAHCCRNQHEPFERVYFNYTAKSLIFEMFPRYFFVVWLCKCYFSGLQHFSFWLLVAAFSCCHNYFVDFYQFWPLGLTHFCLFLFEKTFQMLVLPPERVWSII